MSGGRRVRVRELARPDRRGRRAGGRDDDRPGRTSRSPPSEREVFLYLVGQAAASVENVALHELVSEQAVTDDLTGLANGRAFRDRMEKEAARAVRFGTRCRC